MFVINYLDITFIWLWSNSIIYFQSCLWPPGELGSDPNSSFCPIFGTYLPLAATMCFDPYYKMQMNSVSMLKMGAQKQRPHSEYFYPKSSLL